jgi:anti-sigma factor RsiW
VNEPDPGGAMNECRECEPLFAPYVDGEAASCDGDRVRRHVESCACCRDALARGRLAREAVWSRRVRLRACAPDQLKARCASYAATVSSGPQQTIPSSFLGRWAPVSASPSFFRRWAPVSVAATLLLAVGVVFGLGLNDKVQALAFQTTIDHVKCSRFHAGSAPADPLVAARNWQSTFGWAIRVPASTVSGLELRGVRRCAVTDGRVAHLMYSWLGEPLSVYVLPKRTLGEATEFVRRFRHNSAMWSQNDRTYIIVTAHHRDPALDTVIAYVRANVY